MAQANLIHEETLMCCNRKRCPTVKIFADGSVELADDDAENGSFGTIKLHPEVAARLMEILFEKGK